MRKSLFFFYFVALALMAGVFTHADDVREEPLPNPIDEAVGASEEPAPTLTPEGQEQAVGGLTFHDEFQLTVANIIVYVTNRQGEAITDLTVEDFEVYQDGSQREITNFELYTEDVIKHHLETQILPGQEVAVPEPPHEGVADEQAPKAQEPRQVHMVMYIDNENLDPLDRNRVLSQATAFIRENLHPPAQMMVVAYQKSFKILQPFTSDSQEVLSALRQVRKWTGGRTERDNMRRDIYDKIKDYREEERQDANYDDTAYGQYHEVYRLIDGYAKEEANNLIFTVGSLRQVISSMSGLPGKKGIIYVSNGLPMVAGMEFFYEISRTYQDTTILNQITRFDRTRVFQQLSAAANAQDVTLYTIDASGLQMGTSGAAESDTAPDPLAASVGHHNYTDSLVHMADETGGIAVINTNDVRLGFDRIRQDMYTYYSVGYPLQASGKDRVHRIKIKLPNHPEYKIRYQSRFVEKSRETQVQDKVVSGLTFNIEDNPMQVEVEPGHPSTASEDRWMLPTHISFPLRKVALLPEGDEYVGRITLFIAVRDTEGKQSDMVRQEHEVRIPAADYEDAKRQRFGIDTSLLMESGRYRIAVALFDQITHQDSFQVVSTSIDPD